MVVGVDPARNGEAHRLQRCFLLLAGERVAPQQQGPDLHRPHAGLDVQLTRQRMRGKLPGGNVRQQGSSINKHRVPAGRVLDGDARCAQALAQVGDLPDAVGQVVRVHRLFQAHGQCLQVAARQAAVGDEAFAHHAALLHGAEQILVRPEGAEPADVDQAVLLGRHDRNIGTGHHLAHDLRDAVLRIVCLALLDEPGVLRKTGRVYHHGYARLARQRRGRPQVGQRNWLPAGGVAGDGGHNGRHVGGTLRLNQPRQLHQVEVALPVMVGPGVQRLLVQRVQGARAGQLDVHLGGVEVEVRQEHRPLRAAPLDQLRVQNLLRTAPLVGGHEVGVAKHLVDGVHQPVVAAAAGIGLVGGHHRAPLPVAHGAAAAVGQQVDVHVVAAQQKGVEPRLLQRLLAVLARRHGDALYGLDAEGLWYSFHENSVEGHGIHRPHGDVLRCFVAERCGRQGKLFQLWRGMGFHLHHLKLEK